MMNIFILKENLKDNDTLYFSHGFNVVYLIKLNLK